MGTARRIRDVLWFVDMLPMQIQKAGRFGEESVQIPETEEKEVKRGSEFGMEKGRKGTSCNRICERHETA